MLIKIAQGTARFIASQSSVQSMGNLFSMLDGEATTVPKQLAQITSQFMAGSAIIRQIANIIDPVYRQPQGFVESIMKDLPFVSKELAGYEDPYGELSYKDWYNQFLPYDLGSVKKDYEEEYGDFLFERKSDYLQNKLRRVDRDEASGKISEKKADKLRTTIDSAFDKIMEE
jgi:hypothetical protein